MSPQTGAPRAARAKGSRIPLTRERILAKALEMVGRDPEGELRMRALADALGTAPMSLYRHVRNKDDLLDGLTSRVLDQLDMELPVEGPWTERALAWMGGLRDQLHEHPAVVPLLRTRTRYAPALLRAINSLLVILRGAGFDDASAVRASREIMWFTFGFVIMEIRTRQEYPGVEVGAIAIQAFPAPESPESAKIPDLIELLPHFMKGETDETFAEGARHLVAGLEASLRPNAATNKKEARR
ncbi:MAG: TetR/AcrR family transcriptional regulator [Deltaproteobacteria bacterium]|nr:TetR/AcrR family transcriptional regulator [Deltaproteobacteria bacterium]MBW2447688.1 TetR/AcrR family transcriptional regulator [Deltaproteobacteria bacterium]